MGRHFVAMASHVPLAVAEQPEFGDENGDVVVTGSRLIRSDFTAIGPITAIVLSGIPVLEDTLNISPQLKPDTTSASSQSSGDGKITLYASYSDRALVFI